MLNLALLAKRSLKLQEKEQKRAKPKLIKRENLETLVPDFLFAFLFFAPLFCYLFVYAVAKNNNSQKLILYAQNGNFNMLFHFFIANFAFFIKTSFIFMRNLFY
jgi:hypothetical protein